MSDKYTDLLDTADRIAVVDLYPARLRTVISDLSAALRETSALLTESRDYGSALVEELRARTEKLDQLLLLANSMDADFESYAKAHPAVQPAHVNETPKSEHDARNMLTPATKGGGA